MSEMTVIAVVVLGALFFFRDAIFSLIAGSARRTSEEAKRKDDQLQNDQQRAEDAANAAKQKADQLGKDAENVEADEDWHKRK